MSDKEITKKMCVKNVKKVISEKKNHYEKVIKVKKKWSVKNEAKR